MNKQRLYIDLLKSAATAKKSWYHDALARGGRWITIHPHGKGVSVDGQEINDYRRILIDGSGTVVAGGLKEWEGRNIGDIGKETGHEVKYEPRQDAYAQEHKNLHGGGDPQFEDRFGIYKPNWVRRKGFDHKGGKKFEISVKFDPKTEAGKKKNPWGSISKDVTFDENDSIEDLKSRLKWQTGYVPSPDVLKGIYDYGQKLRAAHHEEDEYYSGQDKKKAQQTLDELHKKAVDQYKKNPEEMPGLERYQKDRHRNFDHFEKHLSKEDQKKAIEAQKVLNGHAYAEPHNKFNQEGHLYKFNQGITKEINTHDLDLKNKAAEARKAELEDRFEKEPALRKLVAQYIAAGKSAPNRSGGERELAYRLFGYAKNEEQSRKAHSKLGELQNKLGLKSGELQGLAYRHKNDILPPVTPEFEREKGAIYRGDHVYNPGTGIVSEVNKVGQKYLHIRGNQQVNHDGSRKLHERVDYNKNAKTPEEHMDNVLRELHNLHKYGGGHMKNYEHVAKHLANRQDNNTSKDFIRKASMKHRDEGMRQAYERLDREMRRHQVSNMLNSPGWSSMKDKLEKEAAELGPSNIDNVPEYRDQPKEAEPTPAPAPTPEPPKETPKPEAAPKGKKEKAPKLGYGDDATMHVPGGPDTFKHMKQLKHTHNGKWNGEHQRWEFNHATGSEGHNNLKTYSDANGLQLNVHGQPEGEKPTPAPEAPKEQGPGNEGGKTGKVIIGGNSYPHKFSLKTEHGAKWNKDTKQWEIPDVAHGSDKHKAIQKFAQERGLTADHEHDEKAPAPVAPTPEPPKEAPKPEPKPEKKPEPEHDPEAEKYRGKEFKGKVSDWAKKDPSEDEIKAHVIHEINEQRFKAGQDMLHNAAKAVRAVQNPYIQQRAAEISAALDKIKERPELGPIVDRILDEKKQSPFWASNWDTARFVGDAVKQAESYLKEKHHTLSDGRRVDVDTDPRYGKVKGSRGTDHYHRVQLNGTDGRFRTHYVPVPKTKAGLTKEHIAKWVEGAGDEAHSFIHHALTGKKEPFAYQNPTTTKRTTEYKPFEAPPSRNTKSYMDKAKDDMMAHGVHAVVYNGTGTAEERAKAAHVAATGMRALSHLLGENMPSVELVIGGTKGNTLAHYRAGYRSITINPKVGRNSFIHEFGHFLDDAVNGFTGLSGGSNPTTQANGKYRTNTAFHALARELENSEAAKTQIDTFTNKIPQTNQFLRYYKQDHERFARFFAQWVPYEAKKRGYEIPEELYKPHELQEKESYGGHKYQYGEKYSDAELEKFGSMVKDVLKSKGLWKGFLQFLQILGGQPIDGPKLYIKL